MSARRRALLAAALAAGALGAGCAPVGVYHIEEMAAHRLPVPALVTGDGRLAAAADSTVVLVYGDNRGGLRMQCNA